MANWRWLVPWCELWSLRPEAAAAHEVVCILERIILDVVDLGRIDCVGVTKLERCKRSRPARELRCCSSSKTSRSAMSSCSRSPTSIWISSPSACARPITPRRHTSDPSRRARQQDHASSRVPRAGEDGPSTADQVVAPRGVARSHHRSPRTPPSSPRRGRALWRVRQQALNTKAGLSGQNPWLMGQRKRGEPHFHHDGDREGGRELLARQFRLLADGEESPDVVRWVTEPAASRDSCP